MSYEKAAIIFWNFASVRGGYGQILTFDFSGLAGNEASAISNYNASCIMSSTIIRGSGLTASTNADRFNATSWALTSIANAVSGNDYMEFTITPSGTTAFSVSSIVISMQRSGTGPSGIALRSSIDGYASNLDGEKSIIDNLSTQTFTFTFAQAASTSPVTYRVYMWAEATGGSGGPGDATGNDIIVNGNCETPCATQIEIESILVDACEEPSEWEGENEMFRFTVSGDDLDISNISVTWPNNSWLGLCQNATTASIVSAINSTITGGGQLVEPIGGIIPEGATVMFFTNTQFNYSLFDFSDLNYTLYAIFQCEDNHPGHFVNYNSTPLTFRTLILKATGCDADTVTYDAHEVYSGDGATVDFAIDGTPTYSDTGTCSSVPIFELPIELLYFYPTCEKNEVVLSWATLTETNNSHFIILKSYDAVNFEQVAIINGAGNSNSLIEYNYSYNESSDIVYYKLKQVDFDGQYSYSNIAVLNCQDYKEKYQIIPNPAHNGLFTITNTTEEDVIEIFDSFGKKYSRDDLSNGFYAVFVNKEFVGKLIVD